MRVRSPRPAFTLIELLVVIAIIAVLLALILPAIQRVREAANRMKCGNNLHNLGIALHHYTLDHGMLPPAGTYPAGMTFDSWSMQARILPYIEQDNLQKLIDFSLSYAAQPVVTQTRVPTFMCPTELNDRPRPAGALTYYPLNYAVCQGTWFLYDPNTRQVGDGAFVVASTFRQQFGVHGFNAIRDGTSYTLCMSEVKAFTPYFRDGGVPHAPGVPPPTDPAQVLGYGGDFKADSGHTEWVDGRVHQAGFTTTFPPNTKVLYVTPEETYDVDFNSSREGKTADRLTYAAVTARSHHPGLVNALFLDGSVRPIRNDIHLSVWRALGTRNGGEPLGDEDW